jgi:ankyrin repeat protein
MATIHQAAKNGNINRVRNLLNQGTNVNAREHGGGTPLHFAAVHGRLNMVRFLLSRGASVNARNQNGKTPLHKAAMDDHVRIIEELLRRGARMSARDKWGRTPLHDAVIHYSTRAVRSFIEAGAKLSYRNVNSKTPLNVAWNNATRSALSARSVQKWKNFTQKRVHARNTAMRETLSRIPVREGNVMRQGLPLNIINRISRSVRRKNSSS